MTNILVVSPTTSHPPQNGAKRRIHTLLMALKAQGHRIHFVYTGCEVADVKRVTGLMAQDWDSVDAFPTGTEFTKTQGEDYGIDDWINPALCDAISGLVEKYQASICLTNYVFQSRYFDFLPDGVLKILDVHDRLARRHIYTEMGIEPGFYYTTESEEMRGLARADIVLSIQDNEVDYFEQAGKPVVVVGHMAPVASLEKRYTKLEKLGYIGAFNKFNIHALEEFIPAFAEYVDTLDRTLVFSIAGSVAKYFSDKPEFHFDCISFDGYVDDIGEYLEQIDLFVNPTLLGTGLKIKSVEALSYGVPAVSTAVGWDGLQGDPAFHLARDVPDLIAAIDLIRIKEFDVLTKLSNFAKASFSEYQWNLEQNLIGLFSQSHDETLSWARAHPHYIGSRQEENPEFMTLDMAFPPPAKAQRVKIAHVVNPVRMPKMSDLYIAQPMAFRAMERARDSSVGADVVLVSKRYPEDAGYLADTFDIDLELKRSAQDLDILPDARKLPILSEVFSLDGLPDDVTHIVYTNSDIGVQPHFYDFVAARIAEGHDGLIINRRTMAKRFTRSNQLADIYTEFGEKHPGFDCFVVSREVLEKCNFRDTLIGVHLIGRVVFWNILAQAKKIGYFDDCHLTFHIGDDVPSKGRATLPYIKHNLVQGAEVASDLRKAPGRFLESERLKTFERVLHVSPSQIQGRFDPEEYPHNVVCLHSFFRTGSTYVYQKVRNLRGWTAYYEPFHEELAQFSLDGLAGFREKHANSKFRHAEHGKPDPSKWLFAEYEPLMTQGIQGVQGFDRRLSYCHDFDRAKEIGAAYLHNLVAKSTRENVFLQFNRTALRQSWMKDLLPEATHIYLQRNPRDIWGSYLSFRNNAVYGFLRNNLAVLNFNATDPLMQALAQHMPAYHADFIYFFHSKFDDIFTHYTMEQHYLIHATFCQAAKVQAQRAADLIIDLERVAQDRLFRMETEARLASLRLDISFHDNNLHRYHKDDLKLSHPAMERIENLARTIVAEVYNAPDPEAVAPTERIFPQTHTKEVAWALKRSRKNEIKKWANKVDEKRNAAIPAGHVPSVIELGKSYRVQDMDALGILAFGFHKIERYHVWSSGGFSMLRFRAPETGGPETGGSGDPEDLTVSLRIDSHPKMAERNLDTLLYVNGELGAELRLGADWQIHNLKITAQQLQHSNGVVEIGVVCQRHFDGTKVGDRRMAMCLSQMTVEKTADV